MSMSTASRRDLLKAAGLAIVGPCLEPAVVWAAKESPAAKYGGYGAHVTGGEGHPIVEVKRLKELKDAPTKGNAIIQVKADIDIPARLETKASNITLDGLGQATLRGDKITNRSMQMLRFGGKNIIIKNVHCRNGGDNLEFHGAKDVVCDHVSCTGSGDDGISLGYGAENCTITHCFLAGCTRGIFVKYNDTKRVTVDHCIICKIHMRAPLVDNIDGFDVRNNLIIDWGALGTRISGAKCNGNVMGNIYVAEKGLKEKAIIFGPTEPGQEIKVGNIYIADNVFRNCETKSQTKGNVDKPLAAPDILPRYTTDLVTLEQQLLSDTAGAGCMPRDAIDKAYLASKLPPPSSYHGIRLDEKGIDHGREKPPKK